MSNEKIIPIDKFGVKTLSIGNLIDPGKATIWRGPLIHTALTQMISDAAWGDLDYFIIDLPPGTGDVQISLAQLLKIKGFLAVSTPQDMSLVDVVKAIDMFEKVNVPLIGIVENMSYFVCDSCEKNTIFSANRRLKLMREK
jgi:ATP-binding protein involved in chromosome partitioning